jgi:hypothetical protein
MLILSLGNETTAEKMDEREESVVLVRGFYFLEKRKRGFYFLVTFLLVVELRFAK